jgi:hypothetical protein
VTPAAESSALAPQASLQNATADHTRVLALVERCIDDAKRNTSRLDRDRQDLLNLKFYRGGKENQWVVWDVQRDEFVQRPYEGEAGLPAYVPRCCTNKFASKIDGIAAILNGAEPAMQAAPQTGDDEDQATARVAGDAVPVLEHEIGWPDLEARINQLITLTDKVAVVYYHDADPKYGSEVFELTRCLDCDHVMEPRETIAGEDDDAGPVCAACGGTNLTVDVDASTGIPRHIEEPLGRICADLWTSYEFSLPSNARVIDADKVPWVLGHQEMSVEEACRLWPDHAEHIRQHAGQTTGHRASGLARQYVESMRALSSPRTATAMSGQRQSATSLTVYRLYHDPIVDGDVQFPDGLHAVVIGERVMEAGPLAFTDDRGRPIKNVILRTFADTPGSPHGKPPADDLVPLQEARNRIESLIELILMHDAAPREYLPAGVTIEDESTGAPGERIRYRSLTGEKPVMVSGQNPPEGLFKRLEQIDADMDELSKLNAVLQGERPKGDPTLGEVQMLQEQGMAAFRTPLSHLTRFRERQARMLLTIARETAWHPRFYKVLGEDGQWAVDQFTAADLTGKVDISIDPMTAWPKSPTMEMVKLGKALEMGAIVPAQDPEVATKVLDKLNLLEFKSSIDADKQQVVREIDRWKAARLPQEIAPPLPDPLINVQLHLWLKTNFLKSEGAEQLRAANPPVWEAMVMHVQQLQQRLMPPAPVQAPTGPDGSAVQAAVEAGVLSPEQAPQDPMQALVQSGALQPEAASAGPQGPSVDDLIAGGVMTPEVPMPPTAMPPG